MKGGFALRRKKINHDDGWFGPRTMTQQLYKFADAYYYGVGRERTYKHAAIKAGVNPNTAHTTGSTWAKYNIVQEYWKMLDETIGLQRRAIHLKALQRLEELAEADDITDIDLKKVEINNSIIEKTTSAFDISDKSLKSSTDESTNQTIAQILLSIQALHGGEDSES